MPRGGRPARSNKGEPSGCVVCARFEPGQLLRVLKKAETSIYSYSLKMHVHIVIRTPLTYVAEKLAFGCAKQFPYAGLASVMDGRIRVHDAIVRSRTGIAAVKGGTASLTGSPWGPSAHDGSAPVDDDRNEPVVSRTHVGPIVPGVMR